MFGKKCLWYLSPFLFWFLWFYPKTLINKTIYRVLRHPLNQRNIQLSTHWFLLLSYTHFTSRSIRSGNISRFGVFIQTENVHYVLKLWHMFHICSNSHKYVSLARWAWPHWADRSNLSVGNDESSLISKLLAQMWSKLCAIKGNRRQLMADNWLYDYFYSHHCYLRI